MSKEHSLSKRGRAAIHTELRPDFKIFFEATQNIWDEETNPSGAFPLNMAENKLCWPMLRNKIHEILRINEIPNWVANYTGISGHDEFVEVMAGFISKFIAKTEISHKHLASSAGVTAVLEVASWVICNSGDVAVIPAPSYPVYTQDIGNKSGVERYDLLSFHNINEVQEGVKVTVGQLEDAWAEIKNNGKKFKLLILTSPDNPTGTVYELNEIESIADWCINNQVHLIINELYGLSIIDTSHDEITSDYSRSYRFQSAFPLVNNLKSDYVHIIYGLSKDFSISGFRVGFIYSLNEHFLEAYKNLNAPHMVSNLTQWVMLKLFDQDNFIASFIRQNQKELTESYVVVVRALKKLKIPYIPSRGGLFVWIDLSDLMSENTYESEHQLWLSLYEEKGILLTPGKGFGHSKFGQFRLIYTFLQRSALEKAMEKLAEYCLERQG